MSALVELADRCEQASGPDRELDAQIAVAALGFFIREPKWEGAPTAYGYIDNESHEVRPGNGGKMLVRAYTASQDAAMTHGDATD